MLVTRKLPGVLGAIDLREDRSIHYIWDPTVIGQRHTWQRRSRAACHRESCPRT